MPKVEELKAAALKSYLANQFTKKLDDLDDVDTTTTPPVDGQPIVYDSADQKYKPKNITAGVVAQDATHRFVTDAEKTTWNGKASAINDLTDVDTVTTAPINGQALVYESGQWEPKNAHDISKEGSSANSNYPLSIRSYEFSNQMVHPDVVKFNTAWNGYKYWMVATPFPNSNDDYENPSIFGSNDGVEWVVPSGVTNPVVASVGTGTGPFNSDPDMIYDGGKLKMLYRYWDNALETNPNEIRYTDSTDGKVWSAPTTVITASQHILSPAVILNGTTYEMYAVGRALTGDVTTHWIEKRTSTNLTTWSAPTTINITLPNGRRPWHIDAIKTTDGIELLINTNPPDAHAPDALYIYHSTNGTNWTAKNNGQPIVTLSKVGWDNAYVYRGSMVKDTDGFYQIWYSGRNAEGVYKVGYLEGFLEKGLRGDKTFPHGVPGNQRFYFNLGDSEESFQSVIYCVPDNELNMLGEVNSVSGKRRVILWDDVYVKSDLNLSGGGGFNNGHIILGAYHLWVDATGKLRINNGVPASDTAGTIVGTQA